MSKAGPPPDSQGAIKQTVANQQQPEARPCGASTSFNAQTLQPAYLPQQGFPPVTTIHIPTQPPQHQVFTGSPHVANQATITVTSIYSHEKSIVDAYVLCIVLGLLGAHHLYLRRPWFFVAYFCTFGLLGVGYLVDLFRIPCLVKDANARIRDASRESRRFKVDAYLLWFPFGILGFHLFYLRRPGQGLLYFFTFGCLGIGWLVDLFRIPYMVKDCNDEGPRLHHPKSMFASYALCLSPFGIIGAHHYYLNRPFWGLLYTFTFGLMGLGWVVDWYRCYYLVIRAREEEIGHRDEGMKYCDDIYLLWFPFGWMGLHHFYLRRYVWGFLYFFTFGLFGIGWLVDLCRLSCMVEEYNKHLALNRELVRSTQQTIHGHLNSRVTGDSLVTANISAGSVVPQPAYANYGATVIPHYGATVIPHYGAAATARPPVAGPCVTVMAYPQYPSYQQPYSATGFVQTNIGYQGQQYQHQQPSQFQPPVLPIQSGMLYPPTYEEATTSENTQAAEEKA